MKRTKSSKRKRIQLRIRKKIKGTSTLPRLSVYRSNKDIYCQLIDDVNGHTLASASSKDASIAGNNKTEQAKEVGKLLASKASSNSIDRVVFDRAGYIYHGRIKALADGAREGGLQF